MERTEYYNPRLVPSPSEEQLRSKGFTVECCPTCKTHKLVPKGEGWQHDCQEKHQLVWISAIHAACTGCDWTKDRPRANGIYQAGYTVKAMHRAAHTPKP